MSIVFVAREVNAAVVRGFLNSLAMDLVNRLVAEKIVSARAQAVVREGLPLTDYGLAVQRWVTPALVANTLTVYVNNALGQRRYAAFYGIANRSSTPGISAVQFQLGVAANTLDYIEIDQIYTEIQPSCYLQTPVLYKPGETVYIQVYPQFTPTEQLVLRNFVAEPSGQVSAPRLETRLIG